MSVETQSVNTNVLDLLFDGDDNILVDDAFIGFHDTVKVPHEDDYDLRGQSYTDDFLSSVLSSDIPGDVTELFCPSPYNSDSGISESGAVSGGSPSTFYRDETSPKAIRLDSAETLNSCDDLIDLRLAGGEEENSVSGSKKGCHGNKEIILPFTIQDGQQKTVMSDSSISSQQSDDKGGQELVLSEEEERLLREMNVSLPTDMPLTREEERHLKTVRRKIRNKVSAQQSRVRRKEYIDGLEHRVQNCTKVNYELQKKIELLEKQNVSLVDQLKKLQATVTKTVSRTAQTSTCVMVLLLSFALLIVPSYSPAFNFRNSPVGETKSYEPTGVMSRTLKDVGESGPTAEGESGRMAEHPSLAAAAADGQRFSQEEGPPDEEDENVIRNHVATANPRSDRDLSSPNGGNDKKAATLPAGRDYLDQADSKRNQNKTSSGAREPPGRRLKVTVSSGHKPHVTQAPNIPYTDEM